MYELPSALTVITSPTIVMPEPLRLPPFRCTLHQMPPPTVTSVIATSAPPLMSNAYRLPPAASNTAFVIETAAPLLIATVPVSVYPPPLNVMLLPIATLAVTFVSKVTVSPLCSAR